MKYKPMLLHKLDIPFNDEDWITELKLDGIRLILEKFNDTIRLYTRHDNEVTSRFPELTTLDIPDGTILDGELIVTDEKGKPDFEYMMERFSSKKTNHNVSFCVFDVLYYKKEKKTNWPLIKRKELLDEIIPEDTPLLSKVSFINGNAIEFFELVKQQDLEGIVIKDKNSRYQINKRSDNWLKVINYKYDQVYIVGLRKDKFGVVLQFKNGDYAGIMEFMNPESRKVMYYNMKVVNETKDYKYIEPIICEVKYRNLTKKGLLRIPSFVKFV